MQTGYPFHYQTLCELAEERQFSMPSTQAVGQLLRTLVASKPAGRFLELGTGMGLSLAWMIDGMDASAQLLSLDNDPELIELVSGIIKDKRVRIETHDGDQWLQEYSGPSFDLIFADTWPGKYRFLDEALALLKVGGLYVIDDMTEQENWPEGHA
ncbi:MAG: class I SAM-dependent methyltransferase, partial [Bacteroidota bacterium]